jgi:hypothetical protein
MTLKLTLRTIWVNGSCSGCKQQKGTISTFFEIDTVQRRRSQYARTLTPMNTRTQTLLHLRRTEHRQIWRPLAPRRRRECRLPLNV